MIKLISGLPLTVIILTCSCNSINTSNRFFKNIESDPIDYFHFEEENKLFSFYHEPRGGSDEPIINRKVFLNDIRSINLYNVQTSKIKDFKIYFYVFRWGSVGGSIYESIDCSLVAYPTRISINIPDSFIFENHKYDKDGQGHIVTLQRKYYVYFNYFDSEPLNFHFSVEENENEGIYKTQFEEDFIGDDPIFIGN